MTTNVAQVLIDTAKRSHDGVAIAFEGAEFTFRQLEQQSERIAAGLVAADVAPGDRVALWLPNHPSFAAAMYGAWRCGATVVPVHSALTGPEARHILSDSGAKVVFCGPDQEAAARDIGTAQVVALGEEYTSFGVHDGPGPLPVAVDDDHLALIAYTAGTSGLPKGAMLTHANLQANLDQMRSTPLGYGPDDAVLCVLPLFHIFGLNVVMNLAIGVGTKVVLMERFHPAAALDAIRDHLVTVIAGAPPVYVGWLALEDAPRDAFSNVRVAVSGAAPLPREVLTAFRERFDITIWEGYGLTETAPALTSTGIGGVAKANCVGRPLPGIELRLVDEDGEDVEEGDPGEIVVRGPNVFKGYWNKPDETAAVFVDGWFKTGDVGVVDDDGDIYIVDRRRDMVIVSGFNVYPREVEDVLRRHPKVGDVAVVGVPDPVTGERVRAIVVADPPGEGVEPEELVEFCRKSLASYKIPKDIEITNDIPRNAAGKILRRALRTT